MLSQAEKGGVQNTIQNCVTVLQNDPVLADSIRLNLLSERIDIVKPMDWQRSGPKAAKRYPKYGVQKGWERVTAAKVDADGFVELTDKEAQQMGFPF